MQIEPMTALFVFAAVTLFALGVEIMYTYATQGVGFGFSSNRPDVELTPLGKRIARAYANQVESAAYIVPVLVAVIALEIEQRLIGYAAFAIAAGRVWFVLFYYTGLPFVRLLGFLGGSMGSLVILILSWQAVSI